MRALAMASATNAPLKLRISCLPFHWGRIQQRVVGLSGRRFYPDFKQREIDMAASVYSEYVVGQLQPGEAIK
jgi:hypothetical protein